jgi:hypothetical protein
MASSIENKAIVNRFITEVLQGGKVNLVDELLAANAFGSRPTAARPARRVAPSVAPGPLQGALPTRRLT